MMSQPKRAMSDSESRSDSGAAFSFAASVNLEVSFVFAFAALRPEHKQPDSFPAFDLKKTPRPSDGVHVDKSGDISVNHDSSRGSQLGSGFTAHYPAPLYPRCLFLCVGHTSRTLKLLVSKRPRWKHSEAQSRFQRVTLSAQVKQPTVLVCGSEFVLKCLNCAFCVLL